MTTVTDYTALISGDSWAGVELAGRPMFVTFSFPTSSPASHAAADVLGAGVSTFQAFDNADKALARQAMTEWAAACGLVAIEVAPGKGDITFSWYDFSGTPLDTGAAGVGFFPYGLLTSESASYFTDHRSTNDIGGDVLLNLDDAQNGLPAYGLLLHEIGHALGLKHPFEVFGSHDAVLDASVDNTANTVMSYTGASPTTLGQLDKDAAAYLYGSAASDGTQVQSWNWDSATALLSQTGFNASGDTIIGISVSDSILGQGGDDSIFGLDGNDTLGGGTGNDKVFGGSGNDSALGGSGADTIDGGAGNDTLIGQADDDLMRGGAGNDKMQGGDGNDQLIGEDGIDRLDGGTGNDTLWAGTGNDKLFGGDGDDYLVGEDGNDQIQGDAGNDTVFGDTGNDRINGGDGNDYLAGGDDNDKIDGGAGDDLLWGDAGKDRLTGGDGNDQLAGGDGNDMLDGGADADNLFGDAGRDTLIGGAGNDSLTGGADADRFQFGPAFGFDIVWDFQDGSDKLAFAGIAGVTGIANLAIADDGFGNTTIAAGSEGTVLLWGISAGLITNADLLFL